ncbi:MAG: hypothetical protein ABSH05_21515 [Bryobacteraceae bacterium]
MIGNERLEWKESRDGEMFFLVAEIGPADLRIYERSTWEVSWFPAALTGERLAKIRELTVEG